MPESNTTPTIGKTTHRLAFHRRCWCDIVHGPLRARDVPYEPREDNHYRETATDDYIPGPRDFEGEP
jgi:hypothetical protein